MNEFVSAFHLQDTKAKKIKTESGVWISASYKSDRYKSWKEKSKVENRTDDNSDADSDADDFTTKGSNPAFRSAAFSRRLVKTGKNEAPGGGTMKKKGQKFNAEMKRPEQILKQRKVKEKNRMKNQSKSSKKKKGKKGGPGRGAFRNKKK